MKFLNKNYNNIKTKIYIKKTKLFFFFFTNHQNVNDWIIIKQKLKAMCFNFFGAFQNNIKKILKEAIYRNFNALSSQTLILLNSNKHLFFFLLLFGFKLSILNMLAIKLNNKIYHKNLLKKNKSFYYLANKLLIFQFVILNLKKKSK